MFAGALSSLMLILSFAFAGGPPQAEASGSGKGLTVYTSRNSATDAAVMEQFSKATGTPVTLVTGKAGELIERMEKESANPQADLFITVDGEILDQAK